MPKLNAFSKTLLCLLVLLSLFIIQLPLAVQAATNIPGFDCYRDSQSITLRLQELAIQHPNLVQLEPIGESFEERALQMLRIGKAQPEFEKPRLILISGLRANSFAPVEINLRFVEGLLENYGTDPTTTWILDYHDIYSLVVANPDGRLLAEGQATAQEPITWENNANTSYCEVKSVGVGLNFNFPYAWSAGNPDPCSPNYSGLSAASEPETQAIVNFLNASSLDTNPALLLQLDSFNNLVLTPFRYDELAPNPLQLELNTLANKLAYGTQANPLPGVGEYNLDMHGTLVDFAYGELQIPALAFNMGTTESGGHATVCWYFNDYLLQPTLNALKRAAIASFSAYELPFGPETVVEEIDYLSKQLRVDGFSDDFTFFKDESVAFSSVLKLNWSVDLPPWHPQAVVRQVPALVQDPTFGFLSTFSLSLFYQDLPAGHHIFYLQAWDTAVGDSPSRPGLVSSIYIDVPDIKYVPLIFK